MYVEGVQERLEEMAKKEDANDKDSVDYPILPADELARLQKEIDNSESKSLDIEEDSGAALPLQAAAEAALKQVELLEENRLRRELKDAKADQDQESRDENKKSS